MTERSPPRPARGRDGLVVAVTGYTCSGKSEFAKLLQSKGFRRISLGDLTRAAARRLGRPIRRDETWALFKSLAEKDPAWRVPKVLEALASGPGGNVVIDGIRTREEAEGLRGALGSRLWLVEVRVSEAVRLRRAMARRRDVDPTTWDRAALRRWRAMDREEVRMIDRVRPLVEAVVRGDEAP